MTLPHRFLAGSVAFYILAVFVASSIPGLSRLTHLGVAFMLLSLALMAGSSGLRFRADPLLVAFWAFFLYAFASILWSFDETIATVRAIGLLVDVLGATLVWVALWNGLSVKWVAVFAGVGAGVQAVVALNQFWAAGGDRVDGLTNPNELALQLSIAAFLLLLAGGRSWLIGAAALALIVVATITSGSRKMIFVWSTYFLLVARWFSLGLRRSAVKAAVVMLLLPVTVFGAIQYREALLNPVENLIVYERIERALAGEDNSASVRGDLIEEAFRTWQLSPLWGHGFDQFRRMNDYLAYSHNNYTELLTNLGLIGFLLYYGMHVNLVLRALSGARRGSSRAWLVLLLVFMLLLLDVAHVSHLDRLNWMLLAVIGFALQKEELQEARQVSIIGDRRIPSAV